MRDSPLLCRWPGRDSNKKPAAGNPTADCIIRRFLLLQLGIQELAERGLILHVGGYQFAVNDEVRNRKCLDIV